MNASVGLIHDFVGVFEQGASWKRDHLDAMEGKDVEEIIAVGIRMHTTLCDALAILREMSLKAEPENVDYLLYTKEQANLNRAFCRSFRPLEQTICRLRGDGHDVRGADQFLGCLRDAERSFNQWQADQEKALKMRATWMRARGISEEEIAEHCDPECYPADLQEEEENIRAQENMKKMPKSEELWSKQVARLGALK